jgi:hypothetical protein
LIYAQLKTLLTLRRDRSRAGSNRSAFYRHAGENRHPEFFEFSGFSLQPKADPSEALWRKKNAGMTNAQEDQIVFNATS